nr:vegetative cell wall protein gp1-like isoform X1 [Taeniopygia guttata]
MGGSLSQWEAAEAGPAHSTPPVPPSKTQFIPVQASSSQYSPSAPPVPPSAAQFAPVPPSISQFYQCHSQFVPVHPSLSQCIPVPLPVCLSVPSIPQCHSQFIPVSPSSSQSFRGQTSPPPPYLATPLPLATPPHSVPRPLPFLPRPHFQFPRLLWEGIKGDGMEWEQLRELVILGVLSLARGDTPMPPVPSSSTGVTGASVVSRWPQC